MINLRNRSFGITTVAAATVFVLGSVLPAGAWAAECKEMSQAQCEKSSDCSWVSGYTTSKGAKVNSYCRNKSKSKGSSGTQAKESSADSKQASKKEPKSESKKGSKSEGK